MNWLLLWLLIDLAALVALLILIVLDGGPVDGYEDETGFHYGRPGFLPPAGEGVAKRRMRASWAFFLRRISNGGSR